MIVSLRKRLAFLCMPKCASTSIEHALLPFADIILSGHPGIKHMNAAQYKKMVQPVVDISAKKVVTFCLFREPVDWLESWYRYRTRPALANPNSPNHMNYTGHISFNEFALAYMRNDDYPYCRVGRQSNFVSLKDGSIGVDRIFRYDKTNVLCDFVSLKLGCDFNLSNRNISPKYDHALLDASIESELKDYLKPEYDIYESL